MKAYLRIPKPDSPRFSQSEPTAILIGRWIHIKNLHYGVWFPPGVAYCKDPPNRPDTDIARISLKRWLRLVGKRGWLEIVEDIIGTRVCTMAKWLTRFIGFKWLRRIANSDLRIDYEDYDENSEKPRLVFGDLDYGRNYKSDRLPGTASFQEPGSCTGTGISETHPGNC